MRSAQGYSSADRRVARFVATHVRGLTESDYAVGDRARLNEIAAALPDVISLNEGDPDFTAAPAVVEAAVEALRAGRTHYSHGGVPDLREAIAQKHSQDNAMRVAPGQVVITNGAAEAVTAILQTVLEPGDEVLTTNPYYRGHFVAILTARGRPIFVDTHEESGWEADPDEIARRITPRTKVLLFTNPGNPSGAVYQRETLEAIVEIAERRDVLIVVDELYERYVIDGRAHVSIGSLTDEQGPVVTINGFSKGYCMTGWRLGWIVAPLWLLRPLARVRYSLSLSASTPNQWGAVAALSAAARPYYDDVYRAFQQRKDFFYNALTQMGLTQDFRPGGFVGMVDIRKTGRTSVEVCEAMLREARVYAWSATVYGSGGEGWLRVGLTKPLDVMRQIAGRLEGVVRRLV
jgi:aminotransferase